MVLRSLCSIQRRPLSHLLSTESAPEQFQTFTVFSLKAAVMASDVLLVAMEFAVLAALTAAKPAQFVCKVTQGPLQLACTSWMKCFDSLERQRQQQRMQSDKKQNRKCQDLLQLRTQSLPSEQMFDLPYLKRPSHLFILIPFPVLGTSMPKDVALWAPATP